MPMRRALGICILRLVLSCTMAWAFLPAAPANATLITLDPGMLPSAQGWTYVTDTIPEASAFTVAGGHLLQNTIPEGTGYAYYTRFTDVDPTQPIEFRITARVFADPNFTLGGFAFGMFTGAEIHEIFLVPGSVRDRGGQIAPLDTAQFHTYLLRGFPGVGYALFVDDTLTLTGPPEPTLGRNEVFFGDVSSGGTQGSAEIAAVRSTFTSVPAPPPGLLVALATGLSALRHFRNPVRRRIAPSVFLAIGVLVSARSAEALSVTLDFTSLPSAQGWVYVATNNNAPEGSVFSVGGGLLHQDSLGTGFQGGGGNEYYFTAVPDPLRPFTIAVRARVLREEGNIDTNTFGFAFGFINGPENFAIGLGTHRIHDVFGTFLDTTLDNTVFHDYRLEATPGVGYALFVDNALIAIGPPRPAGLPVRLVLGDNTGGTNAQADVASYTFTQRSAVAAPGTLALLLTGLALLGRVGRR